MLHNSKMKKFSRKNLPNTKNLDRRTLVGSILFAGLFFQISQATAKRRGRNRRRRRRGNRDYHDNTNAWEARRAGKILALSRIIAKVQKIRPGEVIAVDLKEQRYQLIYDLVILSRSGALFNIRVNALSGVIIRVEEQ
jgi:uncharacterized membrane protein YkoI